MAILKSQLVSAQAENKASDYSAGTVGRFWINTSTSLLKFDDGSAVRTIVTTDNTQTLTNKLLSDSTTSIVDNSDNTKVAKFECSGITTGTTRTYTWIDADGTILSTDTPTTTKGDILAHSTKLIRVGIGTDGQVLTADSASTPGLKWATATAAPDQSYEIANLSLVASVATNALTVAVKQKDGSTDPSSGASACKIGFRSATAATGTYEQVLITAATSVVIPSGTTIGTENAVPQTIYVYAINNGGTIEIGLSLKLFDEGTVQSSSAISGGSSATTLYSTTARTSKPIRLIGRVKVTTATAGTWATSPSEVALIPFHRSGIPTIQKFTTAASAQTYTTPAGVKYLKVTIVGAGGGGAAGQSNGSTGGVGNAGGDSSFGSLTAGGGAGGSNSTGIGGAGGSASGGNLLNIPGCKGAGGDYISAGFSGFVGQGGGGGNSAFGGGGARVTNGAGGDGTTNSGGGGAGGACSTSGATSIAGGGGGGGGVIVHLFTNPAATYTYTVGNLGGKGGAGSGFQAGGDGAVGQIIVEEFYQ